MVSGSMILTLDDRTRPAVCDDDRQRVAVLGANWTKVDVQPSSLVRKLRVGIQLFASMFRQSYSAAQ